MLRHPLRGYFPLTLRSSSRNFYRSPLAALWLDFYLQSEYLDTNLTPARSQ